MKVSIRQINPASCRTYILQNNTTKRIIMIDPVLDEVENYLALFKVEQLQLTHVIDTHSHADHISGSPALKDRVSCRYLMHEKSPSQCVTDRVSDGYALEINNIPLKFIYTPGHTKDSMCIKTDNAVFTGDTLFLDDGGAGRDDLPGGDPGEHWDSLQKLQALPEQLMVYPAHDYKGRNPSTLGTQKKTNPHLKHTNKIEFIRYLEDLKLGPADWMIDVLKANYACAQDPTAAWIPVDSPACEVRGTLNLGVNEIVVSSISVADFKRELSGGNIDLLLDVRQPEELTGSLGHIDQVINIPVDELSHKLNDIETFKDKKIVTICRSGGRAFTAAQILSAEGFKNVLVLDGGMQAFRNK